MSSILRLSDLELEAIGSSGTLMNPDVPDIMLGEIYPLSYFEGISNNFGSNPPLPLPMTPEEETYESYEVFPGVPESPQSEDSYSSMADSPAPTPEASSLRDTFKSLPPRHQPMEQSFDDSGSEWTGSSGYASGSSGSDSYMYAAGYEPLPQTRATRDVLSRVTSNAFQRLATAARNEAAVVVGPSTSHRFPVAVQPPAPIVPVRRSSRHSGPEHGEVTTCSWEGCAASFDTITELGEHIHVFHVLEQKKANKVHKRSGAVCHWHGCDRVKPFNSFYNLEHHVRFKHTGEKPHVCQHASCGARFSQKSDLKTHSTLHLPPEQREKRRSRKKANKNVRQAPTKRVKREIKREFWV